MKKLLPLLMLMLVSACTSSPPKEGGSLQSGDPAINDMTFYAMSLDGTPYRPGGEAPADGFDCSGFVQHVFDHSLGMKLPRTSREMSSLGDHIELHHLTPGDLVFFKTTSKPFSHVGIYLGESQFIHAPRIGSSIRIENLNVGYWRARYNGARRVSRRSL
ncbi:C40 family peptidase [Ferriphaselus sp. R-1]|uniref:C40 family peptidase n=1 Tax=Ferriphaselus sp. R-1 TaxID=1485544 RepID=UPI00055996F9|nr:C40 family peptidase [Ferriphaselus sp. R-1]